VDALGAGGGVGQERRGVVEPRHVGVVLKRDEVRPCALGDDGLLEGLLYGMVGRGHEGPEKKVVSSDGVRTGAHEAFMVSS
jgi:hypothetical protein